AIVHLGWAAHAFLWGVEREGRLLFDADATSLPFAAQVGDEPGQGLVARWAGRMEMRREDGALVAEGRLGKVEVAVRLEAAGMPALTAVAPVRRGGVNLT